MILQSVSTQFSFVDAFVATVENCFKPWVAASTELNIVPLFLRWAVLTNVFTEMCFLINAAVYLGGVLLLVCLQPVLLSPLDSLALFVTDW